MPSSIGVGSLFVNGGMYTVSMLGALVFGIATSSFLLALYTLEQKPALSRVAFLVSAACYTVVGVMLLHVTTSSSRFWLIVSVLWHLINCYAGWRRHYARPFLQARLLHSWLILSNINLVLYVSSLFDVANPERVLTVAGLIAAIYIFSRTMWQLRRTHVERPRAPLTDLPTVSLLIPARNEDHTLTEALHIALAIDYPKLEVIVLDDCSHDRTPEIVRDFAQEGVRFIQTDTLPENWLGKNYAQARLAEEASGDIFIFCDVDVRLAPSSISQLVKHLEHAKLDMLSVVPQRLDFDFWPNFFAPLLPWWQSLIPRALVHVSAVSPTCYAIRRSAYESVGGHSAWRASIVPEYRFAGVLEDQQAYRYILSDQRLGVTTRKRFSSQTDTQVRLLYPLLGAAPGSVLLAAALVSLVFVYPVLSVFRHQDILSALTWILLTLSLLAYYRRTQPVSWVWGLVSVPLVPLYEVVLAVYSMCKYELARVVWKDRNICYPKLQVTDHLPALPD